MKSTHALLAFGAAICLATTCSLNAYASPLKIMTQARLLLMQALLCHPVLKVTTINSANPTVPILAQLSASAKNCFKLQME